MAFDFTSDTMRTTMLRRWGTMAVLPVGVMAIVVLSWLLSGLLLPSVPPESPTVEPWTAEQEDRISYCGLVSRVGWDIHHEQVRALVSRERHPGTVQWVTFDRMDAEVQRCIGSMKR